MKYNTKPKTIIVDICDIILMYAYYKNLKQSKKIVDSKTKFYYSGLELYNIVNIKMFRNEGITATIG